MNKIDHQNLAIKGLDQVKRQIGILFEVGASSSEISALLNKFEAKISFAYYLKVISDDDFRKYCNDLEKLQTNLN